MTFRIPNIHCLRKTKQTEGGAEELRQHFQLPDKNSRNIPRDISTFIALFQNLYSFIPRFLAETWRRSAEAWLGNDGSEA
jgi:hypothetical protein